MDVDVVSRVRVASDLTMEAGTARVLYDTEMSSIGVSLMVDIFNPANADPPAGRVARTVWSVLGGGLKAAEKGLLRVASGRSEGIIDFRSGETLLARRMLGRDYELYFRRDGTSMERTRGGRWREKAVRSSPDGGGCWPVFLVELPRGVTTATLVGSEMLDGTRCRHITARCDVELAASRSVHGAQVPRAINRIQERWPIEVWIDGSGRLRRVRTKLEIEPDEFVKDPPSGRFELSLSNFGEEPALAPPATGS